VFRSPRLISRALTLVVALALTALVGLAPAPALAAAPPAPVGEFNAPQCAGDTMYSPTDDPGSVPDLTRVFGERLTDYNAGKTVVLYDSWGGNEDDAYPPVCGTRYVAGKGAVSEWLYCTDLWSHVCSGVNAEGQLLNFDGEPIPGLDLKQNNPKLTAEQERIIAWLIQNGHPFTGHGYYDAGGVQTARSDLGTYERNALQILVWCVSDPVDPNEEGFNEPNRAATCEDSLPQSEQDRILALTPAEATLQVSMVDGVTSAPVGQTVALSLSTNLYEQPIALAFSGGAQNVTVTSGNATYDAGAGTVTVTAPAAGDEAEVRLQFTSSQPGSVTATATGYPATTEHIAWHQSPGLSADGKACQVYAVFNEDDQKILKGEAVVAFTAAVTTSPAPSTTASTMAPTTTPAESTPVSSAVPTTPVGSSVETSAPSLGSSSASTPVASTTPTNALAATGAAPAVAVSVGGILLLAGALVVALTFGRRSRSH